MALDRRLREEYDRTAAHAPTTVDPDALTSVVERADQIRRSRRVAAAGSALAVLLVVCIVALPHLQQSAGQVTPGTSPAPSPARSVLGEPFTSSVHGYSMDHPSGWTVVAADKPTDPDSFRSPTGATIEVTSAVLPIGWTDDQWAANFLPTDGGARSRDCFPPRDEWLPVDVGGRAGGLLGGDFGCDLTQAIVFVDHRAYVFTAVPDIPTGIFDQGLFNQMLSSVRFTPPAVQ